MNVFFFTCFSWQIDYCKAASKVELFSLFSASKLPTHPAFWEMIIATLGSNFDSESKLSSNEMCCALLLKYLMILCGIEMKFFEKTQNCVCGKIESLEHFYSCELLNKEENKISFRIIYSNIIKKSNQNI